MTKKVLFYINANFTHFAIAYFLQKKYDCDLYAIVDITNKPKKFFETQKLVNFKKIWYYHDNIQANKESNISIFRIVDFSGDIEGISRFVENISNTHFSSKNGIFGHFGAILAYFGPNLEV